MSLTLRFLGTSASRPTVERNVSSIAIVREGETLLIDCGEGTQRQMMRYGVSFALSDILFTHFHTDHVLGLIGLMHTMQLGGRTDRLRLYGPKGLARFQQRAEAFGGERWGFPVELNELEAGASVKRSGYEILPFPVDHRGAQSVGYALIEETRLGRFNPDLARAHGIPEGPLWGRLHRGQSVTLDDGRTIDAAALVGPSRPGRRIAITGDTRPTDATIAAAHGADLLVHESTFGDDEAPRALETGHSTAREAATVAERAGVRRLILTHFSARYARDSADLETQAREVFPATSCARDGLEIDVPFAVEEEAGTSA
ncbi:MAG TPA: ribonuclease Z [Gemmatimonadaceae bacterium]|jgi:ribonuclease Z|nr:ribonuclease Z [Gemmatimonadaceae bacterium]